MVKAFLTAALAVAVLVHVPLAGTAVKLEVDGLVDNADLAFEGRVLTKRSYALPSGRVETEYVVSVRQTWWGAPQGTRVFRLPGGSLPNGTSMVIPGMPSVELGNDAIFFLSQESPSGMRMPVGLAQGVMGVVTDRQGYQALVRSQRDLTLVDPATGALLKADPTAVLDYRDTVALIESACARRALAERTGGR